MSKKNKIKKPKKIRTPEEKKLLMKFIYLGAVVVVIGIILSILTATDVI